MVTVSTDTKYVHLAWHKNEKMLKEVRYSMAADPTGNLARLFGVYDEDTGLALRGTFIINPSGTILNSEVNYYHLGRNVEELLRKVKANLRLALHADEGIPSKWREEGDKTLKPSAKMVGRVYEEYAEEG